MPTSTRAVLLLLASLLYLWACRPLSSQEGVPRSAEHRIVTDEIGRRVAIPSPPQRVISLAPSVTEMLFALGLGERIVGVTSYCDYPPAARDKEKVGDLLNPSIERVLALRPDLVIVSTATQLERFARRLEEVGIPLYVVDAERVEDVLRSLGNLGEIFGRREEAERVVRALRARLETVRAKVRGRPRPRVLMVIDRDPLIVPGRGAFLTDLIEQAGGQSITADAEREWTPYSLETVLTRAPEVIILPSRERTTRRRADTHWPELAATPALQQGRVYAINNDLLFRPGPRLIEGLEEVARVLHPEAFR
ncbi:MAG: cobalamin-binding protein [Blastocatellia bacterium]|nr:cobalamin-binding protein [Blastocatellia bacterium]